MSRGLLDCMTTPAQGNRIPTGARWAADNGKFGKGWPGPERWWTWLQGQVDEYGNRRCAWAVAPDVPFDAAGTYVESRPWLGRIRQLGVPAAYAAQDGCEDGLIPWDDFDVLFLAGTTEWKVGPVAHLLTSEARDRGKQVHMGRVNSITRLRIAEAFGCHSADGTYLAFGPEVNLRRLLGWLDELDSRPSIFHQLFEGSPRG
jgi:hypothetical protein